MRRRETTCFCFNCFCDAIFCWSFQLLNYFGINTAVFVWNAGTINSSFPPIILLYQGGDVKMDDCIFYVFEQTRCHALVNILNNLKIISRNATTCVYNNCQHNMFYDFVHVPSMVFLYNLQIVIKVNME